MTAIAFSAFFVGFIHSLSPGHWLPVVLVVKARRWGMGHAAIAALTAASGHILVSVSLGVLAAILGNELFGDHLEVIEENAGWILISFGVIYAVYSKFKHQDCHGHEHHGPKPPPKAKGPYLFLFSLGLAPCFAVLPIFATAVGFGNTSLVMSMAAFSIGVVAALMGGSLLVSRKLVKLDHPLFEHHGDTLAGAGVALMGVFLLVFPHAHHVH